MTEQEQILISECAAQEGATDADVAVVLSMDMPSTRGQKCLTACISERIGVVSTMAKYGELYLTFQYYIYHYNKCLILVHDDFIDEIR